MITNNQSNCPKCGGLLKYYDSVKRIVRTKGGISYWIKIRRMVCLECRSTHRELPKYLVPYKHYEIDIIQGFIDGTITSFDLDYEDYPCDMTIKNWKNKGPFTYAQQIAVFNLE